MRKDQTLLRWRSFVSWKRRTERTVRHNGLFFCETYNILSILFSEMHMYDQITLNYNVNREEIFWEENSDWFFAKSDVLKTCDLFICFSNGKDMWKNPLEDHSPEQHNPDEIVLKVFEISKQAYCRTM